MDRRRFWIFLIYWKKTGNLDYHVIRSLSDYFEYVRSSHRETICSLSMFSVSVPKDTTRGEVDYRCFKAIKGLYSMSGDTKEHLKQCIESGF